MHEADRIRLEDIRTRIERIQEWVAGICAAEFEVNIQLRDAVALNIQVIGETARRLAVEVTEAAPEIPWGAIIALRNRIAHGYETVHVGFLWRIVQEELPILASAVRRLLAAS